jgi:hypothetical protein
MRLIDAGGDGRMGRALANPYVGTIVEILVDNPRLFALVADILQSYTHRAEAGLESELENVKINQRRSVAAELVVPEHISRLIEAIHNLYQQNDEEIRFLRGAIVELLTFKLVSPRYRPGECLSNHRFQDGNGRTFTDQIDVAVLARSISQLEGYECKIKVVGIGSPDCTNLSHLAEVAQMWDYRAHVGIVTFDNVKTMEYRLQRFNPAPSIHLYGLENLFTLQYTPFQ